MATAAAPIIRVRDMVYYAEEPGLLDGKHFKPILDGISFQVYPGQVFGIMGMSGAGKTSILRLLMGLVPPHSGDIEVLGQSIVGMSEQQLNEVRMEMGMCFQYSALLDSLTVAENVAFTMRRRTAIADRVIMIYQGKVIASDSPVALRESENAYVQQFVQGRAEGPVVV